MSDASIMLALQTRLAALEVQVALLRARSNAADTAVAGDQVRRSFLDGLVRIRELPASSGEPTDVVTGLELVYDDATRTSYLTAYKKRYLMVPVVTDEDAGTNDVEPPDKVATVDCPPPAEE